MSARSSRWLEFLAACLAMSSASRAELAPAPGLTDGRVRTALYAADEVYRIAGFVGYEIHVEFEPGETFIGLAAGDLDGLGFSTVENDLFLKPKAANVGTNLTVITSRRRYHFDYTASSKRPAAGAIDLIYSLRFIYPARPEAPETDRLEQALQEEAGPRNRNYGYCGDPSLKPISAFDDGVHTRLRFGPRTEWPAVFVKSEDGSESLVNFTVSGDELVLHRVARRVILRRGRLVGCVVNQAFDGGSARRSTGTISAKVKRQSAGEQQR
ncbi:MAG: TrbG/VirB9 family P-type conjugative transfer protein [Pseudomonadota bacterium]